MIKMIHENYSVVVTELMDLAVETSNQLDFVPRLISPNIGRYVVSIELNKPVLRYRLKVAGRDLSLTEVRELEQKLETKLLSA